MREPRPVPTSIYARAATGVQRQFPLWMLDIERAFAQGECPPDSLVRAARAARLYWFLQSKRPQRFEEAPYLNLPEACVLTRRASWAVRHAEETEAARECFLQMIDFWGPYLPTTRLNINDLNKENDMDSTIENAQKVAASLSDTDLVPKALEEVSLTMLDVDHATKNPDKTSRKGFAECANRHLQTARACLQELDARFDFSDIDDELDWAHSTIEALYDEGDRIIAEGSEIISEAIILLQDAELEINGRELKIEHLEQVRSGQARIIQNQRAEIAKDEASLKFQSELIANARHQRDIARKDRDEALAQRDEAFLEINRLNAETKAADERRARMRSALSIENSDLKSRLRDEEEALAQARVQVRELQSIVSNLTGADDDKPEAKLEERRISGYRVSRVLEAVLRKTKPHVRYALVDDHIVLPEAKNQPSGWDSDLYPDEVEYLGLTDADK